MVMEILENHLKEPGSIAQNVGCLKDTQREMQKNNMPKMIDLYATVARGVSDDDKIKDKTTFLSQIKKLSFDEMVEWYEMYTRGA